MRRRRCARPSRGAGRTRPRGPVSSRSSRMTASASVSPRSTRPPGTDHRPCGRAVARAGRAAAGRGRRRPRRRPRSGGVVTAARRCTTMARATSPNDSKKFLVCAVAGQGEAVDAEAALRPRTRRPGRPSSTSPSPTLAAPGLDVEVGDDAEQAAVGQRARRGRRRSRRRCRRRCRPARGGRATASSSRERGLERRAAGVRAGPTPRRPGRPAAPSTAASTSSASRGRSASVAGAAALLRGRPPSAALELGDLRQDRLAAAVGRS